MVARPSWLIPNSSGAHDTTLLVKELLGTAGAWPAGSRVRGVIPSVVIFLSSEKLVQNSGDEAMASFHLTHSSMAAL